MERLSHTTVLLAAAECERSIMSLPVSVKL